MTRGLPISDFGLRIADLSEAKPASCLRYHPSSDIRYPPSDIRYLADEDIRAPG